MCSNYTPVTLRERIKAWHAAGAIGPIPTETWPGYQAPFMRRTDDATFGKELRLGLFGLVPYWDKSLKVSRQMFNARSETAAERPTFKHAWQNGRRCVIAAESIFEPCYETGKPVRWRIARADGEPMVIAGLWSWHKLADGTEGLSFTMLTVNAYGHALMQRFHKPDAEKRMVVVLHEADYDRWLEAPQADMRGFLQRYPAEGLVAQPAPRPPRLRASKAADSDAAA